jgi:thiamine-phosphate pyrophosphorylase
VAIESRAQQLILIPVTARWSLTTDHWFPLLLYYITDRKQFPGSGPERRERLLEKIAEAAGCGVDYVQLREKDLSARDLELLARGAVERIRASGGKARLLINSRTDVALAVGADGVHLRSKDISPEEVRKVWRTARGAAEPMVGVSCHTAADAMVAKKSGADFVVFGPMFGKKDAADVGATDLESLRSVCRGEIPVFALGGVTIENAASCIDAGAKGVAGIRIFQGNDVATVVAKLCG